MEVINPVQSIRNARPPPSEVEQIEQSLVTAVRRCENAKEVYEKRCKVSRLETYGPLLTINTGISIRCVPFACYRIRLLNPTKRIPNPKGD